MAEKPMTMAEVERNIKRIDGALDAKVSKDVFDAEAKHIHERIDDLEDGKNNTWTRSLNIAAIVGGLVAAWLGAYIASKGIK